MSYQRLENNNIGVIVQARMLSSRLPGKILKKIGDKNILEHIFFRLSLLQHKVKTILATTNFSEDDVIEGLCKTNGICCFRGSSQNVLERYYFCASEYNLQHIIRLTGDNPFVEIEELDNLIDLHFKNGADFTNSFKSLPIGVGAEIFTFSALKKSYLEGALLHHKEHVDEYMLENPGIFRTVVLKVSAYKNRPDIRLTVDTEEDYRMACFIVENASGEFVKTREAIILAEKFLNYGKA